MIAYIMKIVGFVPTTRTPEQAFCISSLVRIIRDTQETIAEAFPYHPCSVNIPSDKFSAVDASPLMHRLK